MTLVGIVVGLLSHAASAAAASSPGDDRTLSPYFLVQGGDPAVDRLPLRSTRVEVAVSGVVAAVTVTQVYENAGRRPVHAEYVFPASTRAAVNGMKMTVGNQVIVAKIREREAARRD
jgi:Ca-activated chloride channel family protein